MSRSLLLIAGLVLAAVAAWLVFQPATADADPVATGVPDGAPQAVAPEAGTLQPDPPEAGDAPPPPVIERTESAPEDAPDSAPAGNPVLPSLADGEGVRVEVVAAEDGRPLAGAEVLVVDTGRIDEMALQEAMAQSRDIGAVLDRLAERYRTRADGSVVIPYVEDMLAVAGRTDGMFSFVLPAQPDADDLLRLELKPMRSMAARVVDESGMPVEGARVALRAGGAEEVLSAISGADGIAELENVGLLDSVPFRGEARVVLSMLLDPPVEEAIDLDATDAEPVELRMPPTGSLGITLLDIDGSPAGAGVGVILVSAGEGDYEFGRFMPNQGRAAASTGAGGVAEFPHVGLGLRIAVEARSLADGQMWRGLVGGPVSPGQRVDVRLQPDVSLPTVLVRLTDEQGEPLATTRLDASFEQESENSSWSSSGPVRCDAEGQLRYSLEEAPLEGAQRVLKLTREADGEAPKLVAHLDLSARLAPGINDFGTLQMTPPPLLVSGTVLDPDGEPLAGAAIAIEQREYWGPREAGNFHWQNLWQLSARTDADGRFAIWERVDGEDLRVKASKDGMRPAEMAFRPGSADLVLRMKVGARLAGRVLLDDGIATDALQVVLEGRDPEHEGSSWQAGLDAQGHFLWDVLPQGVFDFAVQASSGGERFYAIEGLRLNAGENDDARITEIDLRGKVSGFRLRFVDPDGKRVEQVQVSTPDLEPPMHWYAWNGELDVVTTQAPLRLLAHAPGRRAVEILGVSEDRDVVMPAGIPVTVVLDNPGAVQAGWELGGWLQPQSGNHPQWSSDELIFDAQGVGETTVQEPGTFQLQFFLGREGGNSRWGTGNAKELEIADLAGGQRLRVAVDVEALERTRRRMIEEGDG